MSKSGPGISQPTLWTSTKARHRHQKGQGADALTTHDGGRISLVPLTSDSRTLASNSSSADGFFNAPEILSSSRCLCIFSRSLTCRGRKGLVPRAVREEPRDGAVEGTRAKGACSCVHRHGAIDVGCMNVFSFQAKRTTRYAELCFSTFSRACGSVVSQSWLCTRTILVR